MSKYNTFRSSSSISTHVVLFIHSRLRRSYYTVIVDFIPNARWHFRPGFKSSVRSETGPDVFLTSSPTVHHILVSARMIGHDISMPLRAFAESMCRSDFWLYFLASIQTMWVVLVIFECYSNLWSFHTFHSHFSFYQINKSLAVSCKNFSLSFICSKVEFGLLHTIIQT